VRVVLSGRLALSAERSNAYATYWSSVPLAAGVSDATRAVIFIHGEERDADVYRGVIERARAAAGSLGAEAVLVVPQFLETQDIDPGDPQRLLAWERGGWISGLPATAGAPVSSFAVLDALIARLADRTHFPRMQTIVVAGHSAGAQLIQRYAAVGKAGRLFGGVAVRYVVANPSSYLYFDNRRPDGKGGFAAYDATRCPSFDEWKFGMVDPPPYVGNVDPSAVEHRYAGEHVAYVVGGDDTDPQQAALDKSCAAEAQGPTRYARAHNYVAYLRARHASLAQPLVVVPGVAHSASGIYLSPLVLPLLFGGSQ